MLIFTDKAMEMVRTFMDGQEESGQAVRIAAQGSPLAPRYELTLVDEKERNGDEVEVAVHGLSVLVERGSAQVLEGATVDFVERVNESGFEVRPAPGAARVQVDRPTGPLAEKVHKVLDAEINPAIAAHGGSINLVDVQGTELYIEMAGGCQGCAMSRMTLRQGVERMIREQIPEVTAIHDVTDHVSGENPYFDQPV